MPSAQKTTSSLIAALLALPAAATAQQASEDDASRASLEAVLGSPEILRSGSERIRLRISGQINRGVLYYDDSEDSGVLHVDNDNSSTRLRFVGESIDDGPVTIGTVAEFQFESNSTAAVSQEAQRGAGPNTFTERKLELHVDVDGLGRLTIGQGDTASNGSSEQDLSGTAVIGYSGVADLGAGLLFRDEGSGELTDVDVGGVFSNLDGLSRDDRLRYDSPSVGGLTLSASLIADERWDLAARHVLDLGVVETAAALAYAQTDDGLDARVSGSLSALFGETYSVTVAGGEDDRDDRDPGFAYVKLGYIARFTGLGATALSIDFYEGDEIVSANEESSSVGLQLVQRLERFDTDLFAGVREYARDGGTSEVDDVLASLIGARVRF